MKVNICGFELKLCPNSDCYRPYDLEIHKDFSYVWCKACGVRGPMCDGHVEDAVFGWNDLPRIGDQTF